MVGQIYPPELQLNKANASDTEAPFSFYIYIFQMDLFHSKFMVSAMIYFDIVKFLFFFGWGRSPFYVLQCLQFLTSSVR